MEIEKGEEEAKIKRQERGQSRFLSRVAFLSSEIAIDAKPELQNTSDHTWEIHVTLSTLPNSDMLSVNDAAVFQCQT